MSKKEVVLNNAIHSLTTVGYRSIANVIASRAKTNPRLIVFSSYDGKSYSCNPRYLAEALLQKYPDEFNLVYLMRHHDESIPAAIRQVPFRSLEAIKALTQAQVWVSNKRTNWLVPKREDQFYIQTWHAFGGYKKCELDADAAFPEYYRQLARNDASISDLMIACCEHDVNLYLNSFWYNGPVLKAGHARNSFLLNPPYGVIQKVHEAFNIPADTKICLYAPTFRNNSMVGEMPLNATKLKETLEKRFGANFIILYRLHPNVAHLDKGNLIPGAISASQYPDSQELAVAADVLISDYSSIAIDFTLTNKPGFLFTYDMDTYLNDDRGTYYPPSKLPFMVAKTEEELLKAIGCFDSTSALKSIEKYKQFLGFFDDGKGAEHAADLIHLMFAEGRSLQDSAKAIHCELIRS